MSDQLDIGTLGEAIALHLINYAPENTTTKQIKELVGVICNNASKYCYENGIQNDVYASKGV